MAKPQKEKKGKIAKQVKIFSALFPIFILLLNAWPAYTENLDEILQALERKNLGKKQTPSPPAKDDWLEINSNLAKLHSIDGKNVGLLKEWIGDLTDREFKLINTDKRKKNEFVSLTANYSTLKGNTKIKVNILVPHPKYIEMINTGLLEEFYRQEPPGLKIEASEKMVLKNNDAIYFQHKDKGCSLLYKLPKSSTLNILDAECLDSRQIVALAELLNIDRLKQKLDS